MATRISIIPRRDYILVDAPASRRGGPRREIHARSLPEAYRIAGDIAAIDVLQGFVDVEIHDEKGNIYLPHEFSRRHPKAIAKRELKRPSNPHIRLGLSKGSKSGKSGYASGKSGYAGGIFHVVYEVRSGITTHKRGILEGVFKSGKTARAYAEALESVGARGVMVVPVDAKQATERHPRELAERVQARFTHRAGYSRGRANREGLTWIEWLRASGHESGGTGPLHDRLYLAWVTAQDPSEYRQGAPKRRHLPHHEHGRAVGREVGDWFDDKVERVRKAARHAQAKAHASRMKAKAKVRSAETKVRSAKDAARRKVVEHACNICDAGRGKRIKGTR